MAEAERDIVKAFSIGNTRVRISDICCRNRTSEEVRAILARIAKRALQEINVLRPPQEPSRPLEAVDKETT